MRSWIVAIAISLSMGGCAALQQSMGMAPVDYNDGTWSKCQLQTKSGDKYWVPIQNAAPIGTERNDGTIISCEPIPKAGTPE